MGTTFVNVDVISTNEDRNTIVCLWAPVLWDVPYTPELAKFVAFSGDQFNFGHYFLSDDDQPGFVKLLVAHNLLGEALNEQELVAAVSSIGGIADQADEELQIQFGGHRQVDLGGSTPPTHESPVDQAVDINLDFNDISQRLKGRVQGQDAAIDAVIKRLALSTRELDTHPERPNGVFLFAGPTGSGKSQLARALAQELFRDENSFISLDMDEFATEEAASRLTGRDPNLPGFEDRPSWLTTRIAERPRSVLLLEDIYSAHTSIWNALMQIFDDGSLTDAAGNTVSFKDTIIIMTTQTPAEGTAAYHLGFVSEDPPVYDEKAIREVITKSWSQTFVNRLDEIIVFKTLTPESIREIAQSELTAAHAKLSTAGYTFELDEQLVELVASVGNDPELGARPLLRAIEDRVLAPLTLQAPGKYTFEITGDQVKWIPNQ
ncbi:MAG: AAA family ATPase [Actinomycetes bacterium]